MPRIPLLINEQRLKKLEELRENFILAELIERFHGGQLRAWLNCWDFKAELEQVEALPQGLPEAELAEALCRIFGIKGDCKAKAFRELNEEKKKQEAKKRQEEEQRRQEEQQQRQEEEQQRQEEQQQRQVVQKKWPLVVEWNFSYLWETLVRFGIETLPSGSSVEWDRIGRDFTLRSRSDSPPTEEEIRDFVNKLWHLQRRVEQKEWRFTISRSAYNSWMDKRSWRYERIVTFPSGSSATLDFNFKKYFRVGNLILRSRSDPPPTEEEIRDFVNEF